MNKINASSVNDVNKIKRICDPKSELYKSYSMSSRRRMSTLEEFQNDLVPEIKPEDSIPEIGEEIKHSKTKKKESSMKTFETLSTNIKKDQDYNFSFQNLGDSFSEVQSQLHSSKGFKHHKDSTDVQSSNLKKIVLSQSIKQNTKTSLDLTSDSFNNKSCILPQPLRQAEKKYSHKESQSIKLKKTYEINNGVSFAEGNANKNDPASGDTPFNESSNHEFSIEEYKEQNLSQEINPQKSKGNLISKSSSEEIKEEAPKEDETREISKEKMSQSNRDDSETSKKNFRYPGLSDIDLTQQKEIPEKKKSSESIPEVEDEPKSKFLEKSEVEEIDEYLTNYDWNLLPNFKSLIEYDNFFLMNCVNDFKEEEFFSFKDKIDHMLMTNPDINNMNEFSTIDKLTQGELTFRRTKGDGNCFFRSVIFSYLERIILFSRKNLLQKFIYKFKMMSKEEKFQKMGETYRINFRQCYKCLIMLYLSLTSKSKNYTLKSYTTLIKLYNNDNDFDKGLICFLRYLIYEYISRNEHKKYTSDLPIKCGNILPQEYEDEDGNFDFQKFYSEELLKMYKEAEKIIIYVAPFILGIGLRLKYLEANREIFLLPEKISQEFVNYTNTSEIYLLYHSTHYDILYSEEFYNASKDFLDVSYPKYTTGKDTICCYCKSEDNLHELKDHVYMCEKCLVGQVLYNLRSFFRLFIQRRRKYFLDENEERLTDFTDYKLRLCDGSTIFISTIIDMLQPTNNLCSFDNFLYQSKKSQCIICDITLSERGIKLPCECRLCSKECLNKWVDYIVSIGMLKKEIRCFCVELYKWEEVVLLIEILESYAVKSDKVRYLFSKLIQNFCMMCEREGQMKLCNVRVDSKVNNKIILSHGVCKECLKKLEKMNLAGYRFNCRICNRVNVICRDKEKK